MLELAPHGMGDLQELIDKLPWRKDAREKREEREGYRLHKLDVRQEQALVELAAEEERGRRQWATAAFGLAALVGGAWLIAEWRKS